jgi:hypothetical protein
MIFAFFSGPASTATIPKTPLQNPLALVGSLIVDFPELIRFAKL